MESVESMMGGLPAFVVAKSTGKSKSERMRIRRQYCFITLLRIILPMLQTYLKTTACVHSRIPIRLGEIFVLLCSRYET